MPYDNFIIMVLKFFCQPHVFIFVKFADFICCFCTKIIYSSLLCLWARASHKAWNRSRSQRHQHNKSYGLLKQRIKPSLSGTASDCRKTPRTVKARHFHKRVFLWLEVFLSVFDWYRFKAIDNTALWLPARAALCRTSVRRRVRFTCFVAFSTVFRLSKNSPNRQSTEIFHKRFFLWLEVFLSVFDLVSV